MPNQLYTTLATPLRQAINSITQRGLALIEENPARFITFKDKPFKTYLPVLASDLETSAFQQLLVVTRQLFSASRETSYFDSLELARFNFGNVYRMQMTKWTGNILTV